METRTVPLVAGANVETSTALLGTMLAGANEKSEMQVSLLLHPASRFRRIRSLGSHRHLRGVLETAPAAGTAAPDDAAPERPNGQKRMTEGAHARTRPYCQ